MENDKFRFDFLSLCDPKGNDKRSVLFSEFPYFGLWVSVFAIFFIFILGNSNFLWSELNCFWHKSGVILFNSKL